MATLANTLTFSRAQTQSDSNGLTDTLGIVFANEALVDYRRRLISAGVDASQTQEAYASGTAAKGTYLYPTDMFWLKAIEVNYQNTNAQDYVLAQQVDVSNLSGGISFGWLRSNASRATPQFDDRGDQFEIFPTPQSSDNLSQMFRIFYFLEPTEYTGTSDTIIYPESLDYRIIGLYIAASYYQSLGKFDEADRFMQKYEARVTQLVATLSRGVQTPIQATTIQLNGFEF